MNQPGNILHQLRQARALIDQTIEHFERWFVGGKSSRTGAVYPINQGRRATARRKLPVGKARRIMQTRSTVGAA